MARLAWANCPYKKAASSVIANRRRKSVISQPSGEADMIIQEMTRDESLKFLTDKRFGRLACAFNGQPYITPLYFARHEDCLYSFSTEGQKLEWMRLNPLVCVEADDIKAPHDWSKRHCPRPIRGVAQTPGIRRCPSIGVFSVKPAAGLVATRLCKDHPSWPGA